MHQPGNNKSVQDPTRGSIASGTLCTFTKKHREKNPHKQCLLMVSTRHVHSETLQSKCTHRHGELHAVIQAHAKQYQHEIQHLLFRKHMYPSCNWRAQACHIALQVITIRLQLAQSFRSCPKGRADYVQLASAPASLSPIQMVCYLPLTVPQPVLPSRALPPLL